MAASTYQEELGERLRSIRHQQGLTLNDVEEQSDGIWKAVVIGSYERGDRAISISKLARLADFYGVPIRDLVPQGPETEPERQHAPRVVLDLRQLPNPDAEPGALGALSRFAKQIQVERRDYNGTVLTIREDDVRAIALAFGETPSDFIQTLREERVLLSV